MTEPASNDFSESHEGQITSSTGRGEGSARPLPVGKRMARRRVRRTFWSRVWLYVRFGPPAEIAQSVVDLLRPEETFRDTSGPWSNRLVVRREHRSPQGHSSEGHASEGHALKGPATQRPSSERPASPDRSSAGQVSSGRHRERRSSRRSVPQAREARSAGLTPRQIIGVSLGVAATIWWFMPWWRPPVPPVISAEDSHPLVVAVDGTSFRRVRAALSAWRAMPGARLVVMDVMDIQGYNELRNAALTPEDMKRVTLVRTCGDTITLSADMAKFLKSIPGAPGQAIFVTSPDTLERLMAIMQIMLGAEGWRMEGLPSEIAENKPESPFRRWRDQLRAQFWRATGISGKDLFVCRARGMGLF